MTVRFFDTEAEVAQAAADLAAELIRAALAERGVARVTAATGVSQIEFLERLIAAPGIDWPRVELFHLDEYIGISADLPGSFRRFIRERLVVPAGIVKVHYIDGTAGAAAAISEAPVDVAFTGIGENGHLAFNDSPADFETEAPFLTVTLHERTRRQQVNQGWFAKLDDVPRQAITMSIRQILRARAIVCIATGKRKTEAVKRCFEGPMGPDAPASALRLHANATVFVDRDAAP